MKKRIHKLCALMLAVVMLAGSIPVFAEEGIAAGTAPDAEICVESVQTEPEAPAEEPEVFAVEPETVAQEAAQEPEEPVTEPEAPAEEPEVLAVEPETVVQEAAQEPEEPVAEPEAPANGTEASAAEPEVPAVAPEVPVAEPNAIDTEPDAPVADGDGVAPEDGTMLPPQIEEAAAPETVSVESLSLSGTDGELYLNDLGGADRAVIRCSVSPSNASDCRIDWASSNPDVVCLEVTGSGEGYSEVLATAVGLGTVTVTATAQDGSGASASVKITVKERLVEEIRIPEDVVELCSDKVLIDYDFYPRNASNAVAKWTNSNPDVVEMIVMEAANEDGTETSVVALVPVAPGEAIITATATDGSGASDQVKVVVYRKPRVYSATPGKPIIALGETVTIDVCTDDSVKRLSFGYTDAPDSMADATRKSVENGKAYWSCQLTPDRIGKVTVDLEIHYETPGGQELSYGKWVELSVSDGNLKPTKIALTWPGDGSTGPISIGDVLELTYALQPEGSYSTISWKSSNKAVATVDRLGKVTAVGEGTVTITVTTANKKTASAKIRVIDPLKPTKVTLDKSGTVKLGMGDTLTLTPTLSPETAQAKYSWKSSSTKIAKVSDGVVTPVGEGTATITVTATRGKMKKTATVKVKVFDPYKPTKVALDKSGTVKLSMADTLTLTPTLSPETAQAKYSWKSSSKKIAKVSEGVVTPVGEGTATITVTATRGKVKKTATVKVKVFDPYKLTKVALDQSGTVKLSMGDTLTLTPTLSPETAQAKYSWKSSSKKIAKVSEGVVTPVGEGTATITVTATRGKVKKTATVKVKVFDPYKPTKVTLDRTGTVKMELYETLTLTPTVSPETAQVSYLWKSSSKKVAVVENGVVTPMSAGTATITCTAIRGSTKKTASMKVKVVNPYKLTEVRFQEKGTQTIAVGDTLELSAYPLPAFTYIRETSWKSSADQIARVSDGIVTALSVGEATITVSMSGGGIRKSASIRVRVVDPTRLDKIELHKSGTVVLGLGKETELVSYSLTPGVPDVQVRWESSDTKVATVREDGLVIPVAYGTATITATAVQGEIRRSASYQVKVVDPDNAYSIKILNGSQEPITKTKIGIPNYEVFYVEVLPRCATQTCGLQWSVSNRRIRLESGNSLDESHVRVYALQEGDAKLTVKASNGKSDSVAITTVKP